MDLSKYRQLFISESHEMLGKLGQTLVLLEQNPESAEGIQAAFRLFHSLKGMSGTMGFTVFFDLAHQLEELMARVQRGRLAPGSAVVDVLLGGVDQLRTWIAEIEEGADAPAASSATAALLDRIQQMLKATVKVEQAAESYEASLKAQAGDMVIRARLVEPQGASIQGYLLARRLEQFGTIVDTVPSMSALRAGRIGEAIEIAMHGAQAHRVQGFMDLLPDWQEVSVERHAPPTDSLPDMIFTGSLTPPKRPTPPPLEAAVIRRARPQRSLRVQTAWIDQLLTHIEGVRLAVESLGPGHTQLQTLVQTLMTQASAVRMVPISVLTERLPRVVRDLARQAGKSATVEVHNADELLERSIIEAVDTALTHLVRNAVEHGIEAPDVRRAAGKPETGTVTLRCRRVQDAVIIELSDDGAGIDRESLVRRAVELGLLEVTTARRWAEHDVCRLLCLPGLSIRVVAGAGAGRGIGMDAVATAIQALGGHLNLQSAPGEGTTFQVHLPRTRGVTGLAIVRIGEQVFGMPRAWIHRTVEGLVAQPGADAVHLDNARWPLVSVPFCPAQTGATMVLLDEPRAALAVDAVIGERDMLIRPLPPPFDGNTLISGVARLPDDRPVLVLAPHVLVVR
jgi:two-component system chemotaxis sensor kinase CheA